MTEITTTRTIHAGWGRFLIADLRLASGETATREIEDHGEAVAVLPYCPQTRTAVLVEQLRAPVLFAGERRLLLEAPAGRRESDDPEGDAHRELEEEVGLRVEALEPVANVWSMPGVSTERIGLYLAAFGPAGRIGPGGGLAHEGEDIRVVEIPLHELGAMSTRGELTDMKTLLLVLALRLRRPDLFGEAPGSADGPAAVP